MTPSTNTFHIPTQSAAIEIARAAGIEPLVYDGTVSSQEFDQITKARPFLVVGSTATNKQILDQISRVIYQIEAGDFEVVDLEE